jgi:hypothetical protein
VIPRNDVLFQIAERPDRCKEGFIDVTRLDSLRTLRHQDSVQVGALVHPTPVLRVGVEVVVRDQVRLEVLLPEADALHLVVGVAVDVDGAAQVVHREAVVLVDRDFLLLGVAHREVGDVLLAVGVGAGTQRDAAQNAATTRVSALRDDVSSLLPSLEEDFAFLGEIEFSSDWTPNGNRIFLQVEIVLPLFFVLELDPRAHGAEVVLDHGDSPPVADDIVVLGDEIETDVILLAENQL